MKKIIHTSCCALLCLAVFPARAVTVTNIASGEYHSLLLKSDGSFWGMGYNVDGELGDGTYNDVYTPELLASNGVVRMAGGGYCTLLVKSDGSLWGTGWNGDGELGLGSNLRYTNMPVELVSSGVVAVAAGDEHSLFLKSDGSLWGMGYNSDGELGDGTSSNRYTPEKIVSSGVVAIAAGDYHSLFLKSDGSLWGMGDNRDGELGDGTYNDAYAPEKIVSSGVVAVVGGYYHSLLLKSDGSLWGMGDNSDGELGLGANLSYTNIPVEVVFGGVVAVAAGGYHSLFLKSGGSLWAMGYNGDGELGDGTYNDAYAPEEIVSSGVVAVAAGFEHSLFLKSDGTLWAMGYDGDGELGDSAGQTSSYVDVPELINLVTFSASPVSGSAPLTVQFAPAAVDFYGNPLTSWNWNFGDGLSIAGQNPSHTYFTGGTYSPSLAATNNLGAPAAGAGPQIFVQPNSGIVVNGGFETGSFSGWTQSGDTSFSSVVPIQVSYSQDYIHSGNYGCRMGPSTLGYLNQTLPTTPGASYLLSCWLNAANALEGSGQSQFTASWNDTTLLEVTNPPETGWLNFQFVVTATSASTALQFGFESDNYLGFDDVSVVPLTPVAAAVDVTNGPAPLTVHFTSPSTDSSGQTITNWSWNFGDGVTSTAQNPTHTYFQVGTFSPSLTGLNRANGLVAWSGPPITVSVPTLQYTATPTNGAAPFTVQFTSAGVDSGGSAITSWKWNFGDGATSTAQNPSHTYTLQGTFPLTLLATNSYGMQVITLGPAVIQSSGLVSNSSFESYDPNTGAFAGWTLGGIQIDGYTYTPAPGYFGHSGMNSMGFELCCIPGMYAYASQGLSTAPDAGYLISFWIYNNNNAGSLVVSWNSNTVFQTTLTNFPLYVWTNIQFYAVGVGTNSLLQFQGSSDPGESCEFDLDDVSVTPAEVEPASATPPNGPINLTVQFNAPATDTHGQSITRWNWDFGDGSPPSSAQNPSHTYTRVGTFPVVLSATNSSGAAVPGLALAVAASLPTVQVAVSVTNGTAPLAVQFTTAATDNTGLALTNLNWTFGDGAIGVGPSPLHTYYVDSGNGSFQPTLTATNSAGIEVIGAVPAITLTYNGGPVVNGSFENGLTAWTANGVQTWPFAYSGSSSAYFDGIGVSLSQTISTTPGAGYLLNYMTSSGGGVNDLEVLWNGQPLLEATNWNAGANNWTNFQFFVTATDTNSTLEFLYMTNGAGAQLVDDVSLFPVEIEPLTATPVSGPIPLTVQFTSPATDTASNAIAHWDWDFGDGSPHSSAQNPSHTYTSVGNFLPVLTATATGGAQVPAQSPPVITTTYPMIVFTAMPTNGSAPLTVQFTSPGADNSGQTIARWSWSFGDGAASTAQNPTHIYPNAGNFTPALTATNSAGIPVSSVGPAVSVAFNSGIVSNGGFETGNFSGWNFPNGQNGASVSTGSDYAYSGTYGAQLGPVHIYFMAQTLSTTLGASYVLSYWLYCNGETPNQFLAEWNGNVLINQTNITTVGWNLYVFTVTANSASTVLEFGYYNSPSYFGLDDISVLPATAASPVLTIGRLSGNQLQISWPGSADLELQTATNLMPPILWQPSTNGIVNSGGMSSIVITNLSDGLNHFYRLAPPF